MATLPYGAIVDFGLASIFEFVAAILSKVFARTLPSPRKAKHAK